MLILFSERWQEAALLVFQRWLVWWEKTNVLFVRLAFSIEAVSFFKLAENVWRLCVRAGFPPLPFARSRHVKFTKIFQSKTFTPPDAKPFVVPRFYSHNVSNISCSLFSIFSSLTVLTKSNPVQIVNEPKDTNL